MGAGDVVRQPELADALERLGAEGPAPFYTGDIAAAIVEWLAARGGVVSAADLAGYSVVDREPIRASYRGREVVTNPKYFTLRKTLELRYSIPGSESARKEVDPQRLKARWIMR